ncbi:uncharacterized protein PHACADRAFT_140351 [Phanerochaete carnosa HHB-10118-sp]|uniref:Protein arginine methyltransferase NDUFAF7 n=1 Tax=Phanerochaete carnosa (strain HHB-10118-sp) TaxID=650164 RepID=K5WH53_PHACS|nr:uncharacterized protein PHACADRAFT_140351 [Phanerochaete carnosa HHB-10118-sp]EKM58429.1 hypothetical protein PHACADRAFT_140351 [Phanerochaete carnosa HHB-10118-sp]
MLRCRAVSRHHSFLAPLYKKRVAARVISSALLYSTNAAKPSAPVTKVEKIIHDTIKATGPLSFAKYMQMCLSHPTEGYYMNPSHSVFGSRGDFTTSPEISQVFGELVAIWSLSQWMHFGQRKPIRLVELGPGRGTLMADILRTLSQFAAACSAVQGVHLVETSEAMRTLQKKTLELVDAPRKWHTQWYDSLNDFSVDKDTFTILIAHEFFDALPFHLIQRCDDGWREVLVSSGPDSTAKTILRADSFSPLSESPKILEATGPRFHRAIEPAPSAFSTLLGMSSKRFEKLPVGTQVEVSPSAFKVARRIGELLSSDLEKSRDVSGCALVVDYGGDKSFSNSFRAFKDHKIVDVFDRPGECDLTTNVDFAYLKEAISGLATTHGPIPQATFLERMGLSLRIETLKKAAKDEQHRADIERAAKRLVDRTGMGNQYQVLGITGTRQFEEELTAEQTWPFVQE